MYCTDHRQIAVSECHKRWYIPWPLHFQTLTEFNKRYTAPYINSTRVTFFFKELHLAQQQMLVTVFTKSSSDPIGNKFHSNFMLFTSVLQLIITHKRQHKNMHNIMYNLQLKYYNSNTFRPSSGHLQDVHIKYTYKTHFVCKPQAI